MLVPRPPLTAYREDLARLGGRDQFGASDATWLSVAAILSHAVDTPADSRLPLTSTLRELVASDPVLRDVPAAAEPDLPGDLDFDGVSRIVRPIVERMEDEGALNLAYSVLSMLTRDDVRISLPERGRVFAQLGRVAWKAGALDTAREHYRHAEVAGRKGRLPELRVRAWVGYSIIARLRGNYPEVRKWGARAAHEAERAGLKDLEWLAYHSLMVSSAVAGDLNTALAYGWRAFQGAAGNPAREASALLNVSQYLLECGQPEAALRGFVAAVSRSSIARVTLPALGGLALAAATLGDRGRVLATRDEVERIVATAPTPYQCASALLELSQALALVGEIEAAGATRAHALRIAEAHSFHEIIHRLEALRIDPRPARPEVPYVLDSNGAEVARAVASLGLAGQATSAG